MGSNINLEGLSSRLRRIEDIARQSDGAAAARTYGGGVMCEIINPLESLNNLVYLMAHSSEEPTKIALYIEMAQAELLRMNEIAKRTLQFCNEDDLTSPPRVH